MATDLELPTGPSFDHAPSHWTARPLSPLSQATGLLVGLGAVCLGAVVAVIFAATLALILLVAAGAVALLSAALRLGARRQARGEVRAVGHSWIAYGLDRRL